MKMREMISHCKRAGLTLGLTTLLSVGLYAADNQLEIKYLGEGQSLVRIDNASRYLLLPVEEVEMYYNLLENTFTMDRRNSGQVGFSKSFATATSAPLSKAGKEYTLRLLVDQSSIEAFDGNGEFAMTNLVFPAEPYSRIRFYAKGGAYAVTSFTVYPLLNE